MRRTSKTSPRPHRAARIASVVALAMLLCALGVFAYYQAWLSGEFLPSWAEWKNVELAADLDGDGSFESVSLRDRRVSVYEGEAVADQLQADWFVSDAVVADVDADGTQELVCLTWKRGSFGPDHPFWLEQNLNEYSQHVFVFTYDGQRLVQKWLSSDVLIQIADMQADALGRLDLTLTDGSHMLAEWQARGFSYVDEQNVSWQEGRYDAARLMVAGDVIPHSGVLAAVDYVPPAGQERACTEILSPGTELLVREADMAVVNLETPLTRDSQQVSSDFPRFGAPYTLAEALGQAGFDVALGANNHAADLGVQGVSDTVEGISSARMTPLGLAGAGRGEGLAQAAVSPAVIQSNGVRLRLFNATYGVNDGTPMSQQEQQAFISFVEDGEALADSIAAQPDDGSLNVCLLHVGEEYSCQPTDEVTALVARLIDAGADAVICSHPHVVQCSEVMTTAAGNSGLVCYSVGNFAASQPAANTVLGQVVQLDALIPKEGTTRPQQECAPRIQSVRLVPVVSHTSDGTTCVYRLDEYDADLARKHMANVYEPDSITLENLHAQWRNSV